jgi:integrase
MSQPKRRIAEGIYERTDKKNQVTFYFNYTHRSGKLIWVKVGKKSDGINLQYCKQCRSQAINKMRLGEDVSTSRKKQVITFDEIAQDFIENVMATSKDKRGPVQRYEQHIKPYIGNKEANSISKVDIENIVKGALSKNLQPATIDRIRQTVSAIFSLANYNEKCKHNPASLQRNENISIMRKNKRNINNDRERYLIKHEVSQFLDELEMRRFDVHLMALIALTTGARAGEILNIKFKDINFTSKFITLPETKNNTSRKISITSKVEAELLKIPKGKPNDFLFTNEAGAKFSKIPGVYFTTADRLFNQDLDERDSKNRVVFHTLRHTFASWLATDGVPIYTIQRLMGHKDIQQTLRYAKLSPDIGIDAVNKLEQSYFV